VNWLFAIALWGALLSTALAVREVLLSRRRIYFEVVHNRLLVGSFQPVLLPPDDDREAGDVIAIQVYNRGRDPIYLQTVGLRSRYGGRLVPVQHAELRQLPTKLDPSDGFTLVVKPGSLVAAVAGQGSTVDTIDRVYCLDGAGRSYWRRLKGSERDAIRTAARTAKS
jgi:hypothetical protein